MIVLGIETTCDETAAAIVRDGRRVLADTVASQHDLHAAFGGVVPELASRAHSERILPVLKQTLAHAGTALQSVHAIAVANTPGLIGPLLVGVAAAKALAWTLQRPLIPVHHVHAHLYAPLLDTEIQHRDIYPAIGLAVSGGHTALYRLDGPLDLTRLGATIDDAIGEAFDKVAAILELGHPGGPAVEQLARSGDPNAHDFPVARLSTTSLDFSFSGLKTAVLYAARGTPSNRGTQTAFPKHPSSLSQQKRADLCAAFQHAAVRAVTLKLNRALDLQTPQRPRAILAGGGVVANQALRDAIDRQAQERGIPLLLPQKRYCIDNAAMIAALGSVGLHAGLDREQHIAATPTSRA